jgi:DNA-binding transcriptional MerR regulator
MGGWRIGQVAAETGVSAAAIRYYERIGLLSAPPRSSAGYRRFSDQAVAELRFIRKAQGLGFALDEVAAILELSRAGREPCAEVRSLARARLAAVDERIRHLQQFRDRLAAELFRWDGRKAAVTCEGFCGLIADAELDALPVAREPRASARPTGRRAVGE